MNRWRARMVALAIVNLIDACIRRVSTDRAIEELVDELAEEK